MSGVLNLLLAGAASAIKDAYFNLTTLLLNTSSTNGAQNNTFLDSSTNNFTITRNGNTTQGTFTPFSQTGWSNYLQGSNSGFSFTGINIGTSQFTFEGWIYVPSFGSIQHMYGSAVTNDISVEITNATTIVIDQSGVGSQSFTVSSMATNAWHHIAVVRNASVMTVFVDGVRSTTGALSNTITYNNFAYIGYKSSGFPLIGYVSNFRVVKAAVYDPTQTTLVVPTSPLTAVANTVLLTCQSNRFVDNGPNAVALTATNSPSVQAFSPFLPTAAYDTAVVGGSGYFDGSGDYLSAASNAAFAFGTGDFELSFWFYPTVSSQDNFDKYFITGSSVGNFVVDQQSTANQIAVNDNNSVLVTSSSNLIPFSWNHVVISRVSTTLRIFLNGTQVGSVTNSTNFTQAGAFIGANNSGTNNVTGYFSGIRVVKGSGVSSVTVPTAPPTAITNTQLLLNFTNAGIYDSASKNVLETVGNAQVSTTQAKWDTTSMSFPSSSGNYLIGPPNQPNLLYGTGQYTIEAWIYPTAFTNVAAGAFGYGIAGGYVDWGLEINTSGGGLWIENNSVLFSASSNLSANVWTHVAIARTGSAVTLYYNGVSVGTSSTINNISGSSTSARLYVGTGAQVPGSRQFVGFIDDLRITKGYARYTANFTPPAAAFPLQ